MSQVTKPVRHASDREALRRKVNQMYDWFNQGAWAKCFSLIDPQLRERGKVDPTNYADSLRQFHEVYARVEPWHIRISLHLDATSNKHDDRPFAYVYVVWQDQVHGFHLFRERWVRDSGRWYTRVAGLVPNATESVSARD